MSADVNEGELRFLAISVDGAFRFRRLDRNDGILVRVRTDEVAHQDSPAAKAEL